MNSQTAFRISLLALVCWMLPSAGVALAEEFVVGVEVPLSGSLARVGTGMSEGISVAAEVFNR